MDEIKELEKNIDKFKSNMNDVNAIRDEINEALDKLRVYNNNFEKISKSIEVNNENSLKNIKLLDDDFKAEFQSQQTFLSNRLKDLNDKIDETQKVMDDGFKKINKKLDSLSAIYKDSYNKIIILIGVIIVLLLINFFK